MSLQPWETTGSERLVQYKMFDVQKVTRRSPRTGAEHGFFRIDTHDWINVVAFTSARELIMIRQYRHGSETFTLEIPGGAVEPGEDLATAALRELREETGYGAPTAVELGAVNPNPALFSNRCGFFLAENCEPEGALQLDPGEDIEVVLVPWAELPQHVKNGEVDHALVHAALFYYSLHVAQSEGAPAG